MRMAMGMSFSHESFKSGRKDEHAHECCHDDPKGLQAEVARCDHQHRLKDENERNGKGHEPYAASLPSHCGGVRPRYSRRCIRGDGHRRRNGGKRRKINDKHMGFERLESKLVERGDTKSRREAIGCGHGHSHSQQRAYGAGKDEGGDDAVSPDTVIEIGRASCRERV